MDDIIVSTNHCLIQQDEIESIEYMFKKEIQNIIDASNKGYASNYASINLPFDNEALKKVKELVDKKRDLNPSYLVVVGIGGSNLGTIAVQEAVLGKLYNQKSSSLKILYADTVDSNLLQDIIDIIEPILQDGGNVILNAVSKSGGTTETIANFQVLIEIIKKYKPEFEKYIVITSDRDSKFWNIAVDKGFDVLEIPKKVGGRFSVFSPVGLFPLGLLNINVEALLDGARYMRDQCVQFDIMKNPAALSAVLIYIHSKQKKNIHDLFLFNNDLESIGKWYRQLMGESIGKEYDLENNQVFNGITPTVSIGSTDLHSMAQLYLGGPYDKFTTFVHVDTNRSNVCIPNNQDYMNLVENIQDRPIYEVMNAILKGVQKAFEKGKRPFIDIILPDTSEKTVGQFLQFKMMEMMYLGYLMQVNPFDQPNVEAYKVETKELLKN